MKNLKEILTNISLPLKEFNDIKKRLGRIPSEVELGMFGVLWSEHCSYKHTRNLLKTFPSKSPRTLIEQGTENAGALDIGNGNAVVFKIESHNHPSAIEPFQGAATGVGGIVRDILAMGAEPLILTNSLRFGNLNSEKTKFLFQGVVSGISWYGNCIGVPNVGGELSFDNSYQNNPLVNAFCLGIVRSKNIFQATLGKSGNDIVLFGARTGRDGLHGASVLASNTFEGETEMRSAVQVADPFLEKLLIDACISFGENKLIDGLQDLGAAGLSSAITEMGKDSGLGVDLNLDAIHTRESELTAYELMLAESQERMVASVNPQNVSKLKTFFKKVGIESAVIGKVTDSNRCVIRKNSHIVVDVPINEFGKSPTYKLNSKPNKIYEKISKDNISSLFDRNLNIEQILIRLFSSPNLSSREPVFLQYDSQVKNNTVIPPGSDASVTRIKGEQIGIAVSTDSNPRYSYLDPFYGGAIAVAEACRNISCVGAEPLGITDCLNFGSPDKKEVAYQIQQSVEGISTACRMFKIPVISGNVSLYNETEGIPILPTPVITAVGLIDNVNTVITQGFQSEDHVVLLLGDQVYGKSSDLAGSEIISIFQGNLFGRQIVSLKLEEAVQNICRKLIRNQLIESAHDCSDGGLLVAIVESCLSNMIGIKLDVNIKGNVLAALFGEKQSRIIVSVTKEKFEDVVKLTQDSKVPYQVLGVTFGKTIKNKDFEVNLNNIKNVWREGLTI